ncbi:MAG TPA: NnrS family protein [Burkholderiaceae bacterium]
MTQSPASRERSSTVRAPGAGALLSLGFRPFYLLASVFAALSVGLWAAQTAGWLDAAYLAGPLWHAHEMLFGFTMAVVAGFLFTAVRNWTGHPTPTGAALAAIAALWVAGRVLVLTPLGWTSAVVNAAFPVAVAAGIGVPLLRAGNRRNYFFVGLLLALAAAVLAVHLTRLGALDLPAWLGIGIALDVVLFIMTVMGGRVIPMFTNNGVPGCRARSVPGLERLVLAATLLLLLTDAMRLHGTILVGVLAVGCVAHLARLALWTPWKTGKVPLVWVLHVAYAWIPLHLALRALSELGLVASPLATHALTIGAIGGLTIGMMTRTARGHTGLPLRAGRAEVACYLMVLAAALVRVFGPWVAGGHYTATVLVSAVLWSSGYALYALRYWPVLSQPRADGKPG